MPFALSRLPDEPIIVGSLELPIDEHLDEIPVLKARIAQYADEIESLLYMIWDMRSADIAFSDILLFISDSRDNAPGSIGDPRIRTIGVGTHPMLEVGARKARQTLHVEVVIVPTLEEALAYARAQIASAES